MKKSFTGKLEESTRKLYRRFQGISPTAQQKSLNRFDALIESEPDAEIKECLSKLKSILADSANKTEVIR